MADSDNILVNGRELRFQERSYLCSIGRSGLSKNKREGDGATPIGRFALRECWYRSDRIARPKTALPTKIIHENSGWCDDPDSPYYNRPVKIPYSFSHEKLWRDDHAYDLIIPIGYNDDPVVSGKGSAIFLHVTHDDKRPTEGCVALPAEDLIAILPHLHPGTHIIIKDI